MLPINPQYWQVSIQTAQQQQAQLTEKAKLKPLPAWQQAAAVAYAFSSRGNMCWVGACVIDVQGNILTRSAAGANCPRIYQPGLLIYSVGPALESALAAIDKDIDLFLCQGHGIAHPRRCGIATQLGLSYGVPSIGCADRLLVGQYQPPGASSGDWSPIIHEGKAVGVALCTQPDTRPLLVSPGYATDIPSCIEVIMQLTVNYRWPEPLRCARHLARQARANYRAGG